jgi:tetraacyldisaccharide 4'-kinase
MPAPELSSAPARHWHTQLSEAWLRRGWTSRLLWPLSLLYSALVRARFAAYHRGWLPQTRLPVPVVVVGNVVVGGAGKTPTAIAVVQHLQSLGHRPGVVSRGHGRRPLRPGQSLAEVVEVRADTPAHVSGDEPALIRQATGVPVFVGRSRAKAGLALLATHPDTSVLVCDDGLQHLSLHADVAVAVFDERGVGNGRLLPAGLLREPWPRSVGRPVDMVLHAQPLHSPPQALPHPVHIPCFNAHKRLGTRATAWDTSTRPLSDLPRHTLTALAGIAKPQAFFDMLTQAGVSVHHACSLADHQNFDGFIDSEEFRHMERGGLVCTEKDAVKLFPLLKQRAAEGVAPTAWSVPLEFVPEPAFFQALTERLSSKNGHQTA